jgi:hypothetical protein
LDSRRGHGGAFCVAASSAAWSQSSPWWSS